MPSFNDHLAFSTVQSHATFPVKESRPFLCLSSEQISSFGSLSLRKLHICDLNIEIDTLVIIHLWLTFYCKNVLVETLMIIQKYDWPHLGAIYK